MLSSRAVDFIIRFFTDHSSEEELHDLIRQTQDPHLVLFAQHLVIYRMYRGLRVNLEYENYIVMLSNLYRDAMRTINEYGVNMYGYNQNMDNLEVLNRAEIEIDFLIWDFIHTYINDDVDYASQLAQMIAALFLAPDTVTDDMMHIDRLPNFHQFFVYNFMMHGQVVDEMDTAAIDRVLEPYVLEDNIPYEELFDLGSGHNITVAVNHEDIGFSGVAYFGCI